jgi:hypothetical protein
LEILDDRTLLSASVLQAPAPLSLLAAPSRASLPADSNHIGTDLLSLYEPDAGSSTPASRAASATNPAGTNRLFMFDSQGRVAVTITAADVNQVLPGLQQLGFQLSGSLPNYHLLEGYLPIGSLLATTQLAPDGLLGVLPSYKPVTAAGKVDSEGDNVLEADRVRATGPNNYDGTGVKVGILSDSYNYLGGASADIASGDLPASGVTVLQDGNSSGDTDEGRAMLQIVHDIAPGATLGFATGSRSQET